MQNAIDNILNNSPIIQLGDTSSPVIAKQLSPGLQLKYLEGSRHTIPAASSSMPASPPEEGLLPNAHACHPVVHSG